MANTSAAPANKPNRLKEYLSGVKTELKKVVWPTKKETYKYTIVVLIVCVLFAILFWVLDTACISLLQAVLNITM